MTGASELTEAGQPSSPGIVLSSDGLGLAAAGARKCAHCGGVFYPRTGHANRADKLGAPLYCGRACAGLARRLLVPKTPEQKRAEKAAYDREYRDRIGEKLAAKKRAWYEANRPQVLAQMTEYRKKRMPQHVEYCRRPEYRAYKHEYDRKRNEAEYAEWAETWRLLMDLEKEIRSQATAYERRVANGYYTRNAQKRRRELWQQKLTNSTPAT